MARPSDRRISSWFLDLSESLGSGFGASEAVGLSDGIPRIVRESLKGRLEGGSNWESALRDLCPFLQAGELSILGAADRSGNLPHAFKELGEVRKESASFKSRVTLAALYPLGILHLGSLIFPANYLMDGNVEAYLVSVGLIVVPLWAILLAFGILFRLFPRFKKRVETLVPIIRSYSRNRDLSRFCRTFAACLKSGVQVDLCWQWALDSADSSRLDKEGLKAIAAIRAGSPASGTLTDRGGFPKELRQHYAIGERTGALDENIGRAAETYSGLARKRLFLATLIYPQLMFLVVAGFVAFKVVSFYKGYFDGITNMMN